MLVASVPFKPGNITGLWYISMIRHHGKALLTHCEENPPVRLFPSQPVMRSFDIFFLLVSTTCWTNSWVANDLKLWCPFSPVTQQILVYMHVYKSDDEIITLSGMFIWAEINMTMWMSVSFLSRDNRWGETCLLTILKLIIQKNYNMKTYVENIARHKTANK